MFTLLSNSVVDSGLLIKFDKFEDSRGHFSELFKESEFKTKRFPSEFKQVNTSTSHLNVLRGIHYQLPPHAQGKLIYVLHGEIFDVLVDLRSNSKTFKQWVGVYLRDTGNQCLYIPEGFGHGFVALQEQTTILYFCTKEYNKDYERGIIWNDPDLSIHWPIASPIISPKDQKFPRLQDAELF